MEDKAVLSREEILDAMRSLSGWFLKNNALEKEFQFFQFGKLISFLKQCIQVMDEQNHHADLSLDTKNKILRLIVTTHSAGNVTRADVEYARAVENLE